MTYRMNSCEDGDLHLHSDDRGSDAWVVEGIWPGKAAYVTCARRKNMFFHGTYSVSRNAWYIEGCTQLRITDAAGNSTEHTVHASPLNRSGEWDWPPRAYPPNQARPSSA